MDVSRYNQIIRSNLLNRGAALYKHALTPAELHALQPFCRNQTETFRLKEGQKDADAAPVYPYTEEYKPVIQRGAEILNQLGFDDVRWLAGALIPKWLNEGRRGWHIDWWGWEGTADTWREVPPQIGLLFYLNGAYATTGALLYLPGSHRRQVADHYALWETWRPSPHEEMIQADEGDVVLLDPRAMHAVTGNRVLDQRNCLTMWYLLDYAKLSKGTRATCMLGGAETFQNVLGPLCPDFTDGNFREHYFPHCKKPQFPMVEERISALRGCRTDIEIIGSAAQPSDTFLDNAETYSWYFAVAAAKAPQRIIEFGVRYGYSLIAMAKGARWANDSILIELVGFDREADGIASNDIARANIVRETGITARILAEDTRTMNPDLVKPSVDIIHVDGDHSPEGIARELELAVSYIKPDGLILVDDMDSPHVASATEALAANLGIQLIMLPTQHGLGVLDMAKRTKYTYR